MTIQLTDLLRVQMDQAVAVMRQRLDVEVFHSYVWERPLFQSFTPPPPRWHAAVARARSYLVTLGWALRGDDLHRDVDCPGDDW